MKRPFFTSFIFLIFVFFWHQSVLVAWGKSSDKIILKLASFATPESMEGVWVGNFVKDFNKRAQGRAEIKVYSGGVLGPITQHLGMVENGFIDMAICGTLFAEMDAPIFQAVSLPFLFDSFSAQIAAMRPIADAAFNDVYEKGFNQKAITWTPTPVMSFAFTGKPVKTMKDFKGLLLGAGGPSSEIYIKILGAGTVTIGMTEVYGALEKGIIDGTISSPFVASERGYADVLRSFTISNLSGGYLSLNINLDSYDKLPKNIQQMLVETGKTSQKISPQIVKETIEKATEKLKKAGIEIYDLPTAERNRWKNACRPIWDDLINRQGSKIQAVIDIAGKYNKEYPY